jgi:hypothetical protein
VDATLKLRRFFEMISPPSQSTSRISIELTPTALRLGMSSPPQEKLIPWTSIRRVVAFKRDVFSHDLLCLALELQPQAVVELDESMKGWHELLMALPARLPGALSADEWLARVAFPAFKESSLDIYRLS